MLYRAMKRKIFEALEKVQFLPYYTGILTYDYETVLYYSGTGHEEGNVHLLRYLRRKMAETGKQWSKRDVGAAGQDELREEKSAKGRKVRI